MLVLGRRLGEEIVIIPPDGREIVVRLVELRGHGSILRVGINADTDVKVFRREVWDKIQDTAASNSGS
jgi:carbon storage regulator CsrA